MIVEGVVTLVDIADGEDDDTSVAMIGAVSMIETIVEGVCRLPELGFVKGANTSVVGPASVTLGEPLMKS